MKTTRTEEETFPKSRGWYRLGLVLLKMSQPERRKQAYKILLEETIDDSKKAPIYGPLGLAEYYQGEYEETIIL